MLRKAWLACQKNVDAWEITHPETQSGRYPNTAEFLFPVLLPAGFLLPKNFLF